MPGFKELYAVLNKISIIKEISIFAVNFQTQRKLNEMM